MAYNEMRELFLAIGTTRNLRYVAEYLSWVIEEHDENLSLWDDERLNG